MLRKPPGIFGPVTTRLKAGDPAPNIEFAKVLHAAGTDESRATSVFSQTTAILFLPLLSRNQQQVDLWNRLVDMFATRPIDLVLITQERESTLLPWLAKHQVKGWLLYDPTGSTARAYGLEMPETIYVGADRKIIGFNHGFVPRDEDLMAVLGGRVSTEKPDPGLLRDSAMSDKVWLRHEPTQVPCFEDHKPKVPPSYEVHIEASTTSGATSTSAPDYWSVSGFDLQSIVARAYGVEESRVDFWDAAAATKRYDVALVLPGPEQHDRMMRRIQDALKQKFNLNIISEDQSLDVYVVTAPHGPGPKLRSDDDAMGGFFGFSSSTFSLPVGVKPTPENISYAMNQQRTSLLTQAGSSFSGSGTVQEFCNMLEKMVDRKIIDETHLTGHYDFELPKEDNAHDLLLDRLHEELGLVLTPERRTVSMLVVRPNET